MVGGGSYRVFKEPIESPIHGVRTLVTDPADAVASPFGWHDTDGVDGPEFTTTRGNNVHAYLDIDADNNPDPGSEPDGGAGLVFDFPLDLTMLPTTYQPAAVTNLFYWNNLVHDFAYKYGFDEASGNFQVNNYGRGGEGDDYVRAEAQDGSSTNNANFFTPVDGSRPRMQMFIWNQGPSSVTVNSPGPEMVFTSGNAGFGPTSFNVSGNLELANPLNGCPPNPLIGFTQGNIAVIDRGACTFSSKTLAAENAGAIAVIICNNVAGAPPGMSGIDPVTIPTLSLSQADCNTIKLLMGSNTVNITMSRVLQTFDSDFDNGVIAHEYAHGISNRLTGGRLNVDCLDNQEQMGEGWSDWYGLMMTIRPGDTGATPRGIGTYVLGQPTSGNGIRPTRYSTDMSINASTYDLIKSAAISVPHGVGYVWCTMLWDLTWAMIDDHGFEAGFDVAMWLVNDGMKLQPCSPGFVTGRNAILAADMARYEGANQCRIWEVFARRGLGFSASQGLSTSRADGTQAFDTPTGLPCPWGIDNIGATCNSTWTYNDVSEVYTGTSTKCYYANPFNSDGLTFANQSLCGNGSITAQVTSISGALGWAGVMMRDGNAVGAKKAQLMTNMSNFSRREFRTTTNGQAYPQQFPSQNRYWLRITRNGNQFSMHVSPNNVTWFFIGAQNIVMPDCIQVGLVVTNYNANSTSTATFANVSITSGMARPESSIFENTVDAIFTAADFTVVPNPTTGFVQLDLSAYDNKKVQMDVFSLQGKMLRSVTVESTGGREQMDLSGYANGMYLIRVSSEGLPDITKRVVLDDRY